MLSTGHEQRERQAARAASYCARAVRLPALELGHQFVSPPEHAAAVAAIVTLLPIILSSSPRVINSYYSKNRSNVIHTSAEEKAYPGGPLFCTLGTGVSFDAIPTMSKKTGINSAGAIYTWM